MKEFLENYLDIKLSEEDHKKVSGNLIPGAKVTVGWVDRDELDYGYCFQLPNQNEDENMLDFFVHMTEVDNSYGIGKVEGQWLHLKNLLQLKEVKFVTFW